jgi:hypothetical protein
MASDMHAPKREYSTNPRAMVHGVGMALLLSFGKLEAFVD